MFDTLNQNSNFTTPEDIKQSFQGTKTYLKVFLYFGLALLVTAIVDMGLSMILYYTLINNPDTFYTLSIVAFTVGSIGIVIIPFILNLNMFRNRSIMVPFIIYSVMMGILLTGVTFFVDSPYTIGVIFLITAATFLLMGLVGVLIGEKVKFFRVVLIGLTMGVGLLCLVNLFLFPFILSGTMLDYNVYSGIYWGIEIAYLLIFMIYTILDINRLKHAVNSGKIVNTNLALYFALSLYTDFINLFLRILYIFLNMKEKDS